MSEESEPNEPAAKKAKVVKFSLPEDDKQFAEDVTESNDQEFTISPSKYNDLVTPEEVEMLKEFTVLDEVNCDDENSDDNEESDYESEEIPEDEIEQMLEKDLPEQFKGARKQKDKHYTLTTKLILEDKGVNQFEVLPLDWVCVRHCSGMPLYLHRPSRVVTVSRPYSLGKENAKKHEIPITAIPCLSYRKALEEEAKQNEIDRVIEEQIRTGSWKDNLDSCPNQNNENAKQVDQNNVTNDQNKSVNGKSLTKESKSLENYEQNSDNEMATEIDNEKLKVDKNTHMEAGSNAINDIPKQCPFAKVFENLQKTDQNQENKIESQDKIISEPTSAETDNNTDLARKENVIPSSCEDDQNDLNAFDEHINSSTNNFKTPTEKSYSSIQIAGTSNAIPSTSYATPSTSFATPSTSFATPSTSFATPSTSFATPITSFATPSTSFATPSASFATPSTSYATPSTSYATPSASNDNPSMSITDETQTLNQDPKLTARPIVLPGGIVMPPPRVENISTSWKTQNLTSEQFYDYCKKLFKFKTVKVLRFTLWTERRRYCRARKALQTAPLPKGATLITLPNTQQGPGRRDLVMNTQGSSYLSVFHEYVQRVLHFQPRYEFKQLDNATNPYQATVYIGTMQYGVGQGPSKRAAKNAAARESMQVLVPGLGDLEGTRADLAIFETVGVEDPRVTSLCSAACEPSPHAVLRTCLLRNLGAASLDTQMRKLEHQSIEITMTVGKHTATAVGKNKKTAKQRAAQAILQALHPHVKTWGSLLRLYGTGSGEGGGAARRQEAREVTSLQEQAKQNQPNFAVLNKLREEMRRLAERDKELAPITTMMFEHLPTGSCSELNNVDL